MSVKQNVVIVGAGGAGLAIAKTLVTKLNSAQHELIVINPRPFEVFYPPLVRAVVTAEGSLENGLLHPISKLVGNDHFTLKLGRVARVEHASGGHTAKQVVLESGESVPYAVLILAPGSIWEGPIQLPDTREDVDAHFAEWREKFKNAKHVVLAGGGAVGIGKSYLFPSSQKDTKYVRLEIAGEVRDIYPVCSHI